MYALPVCKEKMYMRKENLFQLLGEVKKIQLLVDNGKHNQADLERLESIIGQLELASKSRKHFMKKKTEYRSN